MPDNKKNKEKKVRGPNSEAADLEAWRAFGRRLTANQEAFILNNIMRMREMLRYSTPGFRTVFNNIPFLLQVNLARSPGFVDAPDPPRGIFGFERSGFARIFQKVHPDKKLKDILVFNPQIQALLLIGSIGSVGHTSASDLDYWVCVDKDKLGPEGMEQIQAKLEGISTWAEKKHKTEVHFFLMDLKDIWANRLGALDEESSGDVMPLLLKEEFYRTVLHVAGRMPLWWAVPLKTTKAGYQKIVDSFEKLDLTIFDSLDFVDLGFPDKPGPREYIGAALWQAHKAKKDLFKAMLKMILLMDGLEGNKPMLCDEVKEAVITAQKGRMPVDPYLLSISRALEYTAKNLPDILETVRLSAWFKLHSPMDPLRPRATDPKFKVIEALARQWGWSSDRIDDLFSYGSWPSRRKIALGEKIKGILLDLYSQIAARLRSEHPEEVKVVTENLARLSAQILGTYADHETKVEDLPSAIHRKNLPQYMNIIDYMDKWRLVDPTGPENDFIYQTDRIARLAAWLVHNRVWSPDTKLRLVALGRPVKLSCLLALLEALSETFPPLKITTVADPSLLPTPDGPQMLLVNLEEPYDAPSFVTAELIYRTNLGEIFHEMIEIPKGLNEAEKYKSIAVRVFRARNVTPEDIRIFFPPHSELSDFEPNLRTALKQYYRQIAKAQRDGTRSTSKLDTD